MPKHLNLALALGLCLSLSPGSARAVSVTEHKLRAHANTIFASPLGLLVSNAGSGVFQTITPSPFKVTDSSHGVAASSLFIGPDGGTWYLGTITKEIPVPIDERKHPNKAETKEEGFATFGEISGATVVPKYTFPTPIKFLPYRITSIVTGPDGALWMTDGGTFGVDHMFIGSSLSTLVPPNAAGIPTRIAYGPGGDFWVTEIQDGAVTQITPEGTMTEHPLGGGFGSFGSTEPYGIVAGPDGALWIAEEHAAAIARLTVAGQLQVFPVPIPAGYKVGQAEGTPTPRNVAVGPENGIWFTDPGDNSVGRVLEGQVTEYPMPTADVVPDQIAVANGEIWVTEANASAIASINPTTSPTPATTPPAQTVKRHASARSTVIDGWVAKIRKREPGTVLLRRGDREVGRFRSTLTREFRFLVKPGTYRLTVAPSACKATVVHAVAHRTTHIVVSAGCRSS
jgi:virginiamycin B lyase